MRFCLAGQAVCSILVLYSEQGLSQDTGTGFASQATVGELSITQKSFHSSMLSTAHATMPPVWENEHPEEQ